MNFDHSIFRNMFASPALSSFSPCPLSEEKGGLVSDAYGEDDFSRLGGDEDGYEEEEDENSKQSVGKSSRSRAVGNSIPFRG